MNITRRRRPLHIDLGDGVSAALIALLTPSLPKPVTRLTPPARDASLADELLLRTRVHQARRRVILVLQLPQSASVPILIKVDE